jgi:murein DD-endopeptidase MepM/ murein hydrolase activator NlpD
MTATDGQTQLDSISVSLGQAVLQGDIIGYLYSPDYQAHVHFGLNKYVTGGGDPLVCPDPYFTSQARTSILTLIQSEHPGADICNN